MGVAYLISTVDFNFGTPVNQHQKQPHLWTPKLGWANVGSHRENGASRRGKMPQALTEMKHSLPQTSGSNTKKETPMASNKDRLRPPKTKPPPKGECDKGKSTFTQPPNNKLPEHMLTNH